ncbi:MULTISPECIES: hypothetical protein [unclassified Paenibacillus]|uniref:DUF7017 domain-containing protein n=1 Tax=unclassified Paenibacillus TaxID=185978 RepID=UPI00240610F7|nr:MULTISPECIES: hypothetical protein [unclassified Paenibacillus]MDF9843790.1 hypothetical protein [Paenibacillus sp. PastF-2]MDF9850371.1 hypothetical protein [Paenibacillus sp. PastM-2]MDF9856926.1 hypothetical protein [Paenibacillus sp. PastF-1]MDH6482217.1 hypothetical protein [Paenibacillus sp. PastH-2]MDH6509619.1 hypothetical protein [Paenibacillus sp. PastM-3]
MYTTKNHNDDLYQICTKYFVKFKLLQDFANQRIDESLFVQQLKLNKEDSEITEILMELRKITEKVQRNGGKLDQDPIDEAKKLRKMEKLQEAFQVILPYLKANQDNEDAVITFGWIMYDYLKISEGNVDRYSNNLRILNDNAVLSFESCFFNESTTDDSKKMLVNSILWSIRRVIMKGELFANNVFPELLRFCGHEAKFIENRGLYVNSKSSASRFLIKEMIGRLNDANYLLFMDIIGFDWFDRGDLQKTNFTNNNGESVEVRPLAEFVLNFHAKKLLSLDLYMVTEQRLHSMIDVLNIHIRKNPSFEWLLYYKAKLLIKVNRKDEALETVTSFARTKSKDFWVWDLISELGNDDEKFNCLCAGLLCKSKPEMIVGLQEKIIPILVEKKMSSHAKFELDELISTRMKKWGKISQQLEKWKSESWYLEAKPAKSRDDLKEFADQAEEILYRTLPFTNIFVTYINKDKGVVNFAYLGNSSLSMIKDGYFYMDSIKETHHWITDEALKVRMVEDKKRPNLFKLYKLAPGDETFLSNFVQTGSGYVDKEYTKPFAFVNDAFISPKLVEEHNIQNDDKVDYIQKRRFNKKKNAWGWTVEKITSVEKSEQTEYEEEEY